MDFKPTQEQEAFRQEFTDWLKSALPADWDPNNQPRFEDDDEAIKAYRDLQKKLFDASYVAMHYPKEYGGGGKGVMEDLVVMQALSQTCGSLRGPGTITHAMAVPLIFNCGSEEQKKDLLPKTLSGKLIWCQGFSEPDAGSDVANIQTLAIREEDHYVVNGQKVWTSLGHLADYCMLVVRTDPGSRKHKGLSYLLVDLKIPGIDIRPMRQMTGESEFNEIFFDNAKVPAVALLGEEGEGWKLIITTLMFERVMGDVISAASFESNFFRILNSAKITKRSGKSVLEDPVTRQDLGQSYIELMALKYHGLRNLSNQLKGGIPGPEGSIGKLLWSEPNRKITERVMGMQGPNSQITAGPSSIHDGTFQYQFLRAKGNTIEAGTSEIQRNIIGERVLGLPKDASRIKK